MSMNRLSPQQKRRRKKRILITCLIVALVIATVAVGLMFLQRSITEKYAETEELEVLTATVSTGSIRTTVSGSGTLSNEESSEVILPAKLLLDEIFVNRSETVEVGDLLATVNTESIITAMAELQTELDELDEELSEAETEEVDSSITAAVSGRVKAVYAAVGEDVSAVMYEDGALILLSLDGYMTVTLDMSRNDNPSAGSGEPQEEEALPELAVGDSVTVTEADGDSFTGTIDRIAGDTVQVLLTDYGPAYGEEVTVSKDDVEIGTGTLKIHEPLAITGYAGTVDYLYVSVNEWVYAGNTLLTLSNTSYTAHYESLLQERAALEEDLQTLITIYQEGGIYAPIAGKVDSLSYSDRNMPTTASSTDSTLLSIRPSDSIVVTVYVDESDILNLSAGQDATVTVSSIEDETFRATVTEVATEGTSSGGVTQYAVTLTMERTDSMRSGMTATAAISISGAENALLLPSVAVQSSRNTYYVYTGYDAELGELTGAASVEIGVTGNGNIEITQGLSEGDTVYYTQAQSSSSGFSSFGGGGFSSGEMSRGGRG